MSLSDDALVSLAEVKRFYFHDMEKSKSQDDDLFEELIDRITDQFELYCGVDSFHDNDYTEYIDGNGSEYVFVKNNPLNSIASIYDDVDWTWAAGSIVSSSDYRIADSRYIVLKYSLYNGTQNIKLTYNAGYTTIPGDLKQACIKEVVRGFKHRQDFDILSRSLDDGSVNYAPEGLLVSTKQIIDKYKRVKVA